jgi:hypothetical protein
MKTKLYVLAIISLGLINISAMAQKPYTETSGEIIFSMSQASFTQEFMDNYDGASLASNNVRFTCFFHVGEYVHYDLSNSFGLFSGLAIRNIGMITDETLPQQVAGGEGSVSYGQYKIIRRQYTLGLPLAIKIGAFDKHLYFFGGGEYELAFHFKEKYWTGNYERSGDKTKDTEWFSSQTPTFLPSVFGGIQFPYGLNVKFKYYLSDFLDSGFKGNGNNVGGSIFDISDQSRYKESNMFYFSLCWQFNTGEVVSKK